MCRHFTRIDKINDGRVESKLKCPLARKPLQFFSKALRRFSRLAKSCKFNSWMGEQARREINYFLLQCFFINDSCKWLMAKSISTHRAINQVRVWGEHNLAKKVVNDECLKIMVKE